MKLTKQFIEDGLAGLIGQKVDYDVFSAQSKAREALTKYAEANGLDPRDFGVHKDTGSWALSLTYKKYPLAGIEIRRKKGAYHPAIWGPGGSHDWTYKEFRAWIYDHETEVRIANIDRMVAEKQSAAARDEARGKEAIKLLKKTYGLDDAGATDLIKYLYEHRYSLVSE